MQYNDLTRRRFEELRHAGTLSAGAVRRGAAGSRSAGTWVQFDASVAPDGSVSAASFLAYGCPHVLAVADFVAETAVGRLPVQSLPEPLEALAARFGVPVEKLGRLLIVEDAWIAALAAPAAPRRG